MFSSCTLQDEPKNLDKIFGNSRYHNEGGNSADKSQPFRQDRRETRDLSKAARKVGKMKQENGTIAEDKRFFYRILRRSTVFLN